MAEAARSANELVSSRSQSTMDTEESESSKRAQRAQELRDAFRARQREIKERHVERLTLGTGLGASAAGTLLEGCYNPETVLAPQPAHSKRLDDVGTPGTPPATTDEDDASADSEKEPTLLEKMRSTARPVTAILQARNEMVANLNVAESELSATCEPFLFDEVLEALCIALDAIEEGNRTAAVSLPTLCREEPSTDSQVRAEQRRQDRADPLYLHGAEAVLQYARERLLPVAYLLVPLTHTAQWVAQYTVAFLRSLAATTQEEAQVRVELLARCVRLVGKVQRFSAVVLSIEAKSEEYDAFYALQASAEEHIGTLLEDVEHTLSTILAAPFPSRRARLCLVDKALKAKLQRALLFLNEIDCGWTPNVKLHVEWKNTFLGDAFRCIQCTIAPFYARCLMGFIDDALYTMVKDTRVTGRMLGSSPVQPQVPLVRQVEYERVSEKLTLQQIGMLVKSNASIVVGAQLCMGARYVLRQSTREFDGDWGFAMDEKTQAPTQSEIDTFLVKFTAKAKRKVYAEKKSAPAKPRQTNATFLTQEECA